MGLEALVFDVDGTLADTEEAHREAFNAAFLEHGLDWYWSRSRYSELLGVSGGRERMLLHLESLPQSQAAKAALGERIPEIHRSKVRAFKGLAETGQIPLRPGVRRLIKEARDAGLKLGIATTGTAAGVEALITRNLGDGAVGWFRVFAAGHQVPNKKPAPEIYRLVLQSLKTLPSEAVAFEDSENGVRAARAAGLFVIATPSFWTLAQDFSQSDLLLPTLGDPDQPIPEPIARLRIRGAPFVDLAVVKRLHAASVRGSEAVAPGAG